MLRHRRLPVVLFAALGLVPAFSWAAPASADVQACLNASEKGQKLRSQGRLREARDNFLTCGGDACPAIVRKDCVTWNAEVSSAIPTVVFGARDKAGKDLFDVTVSMDGELLVKKLDGKGVTVDPGKHTFKFEAAGLTAVTDTDLVKEGEKARVITVTFDGNGPGSSGAATPGKIDLGPSGTAPGADNGGHTIPPWIVVGVGGAALIAGVIIFAAAPSRPDNCSKDTQKCTKGANETEAQLADDKDKAGQADSQPVLGAVVGAVGLALVAGGLIWHFVEPTGDTSAKTGRLEFSPWTTGKSSGFALGATF